MYENLLLASTGHLSDVSFLTGNFAIKDNINIFHILISIYNHIHSSVLCICNTTSKSGKFIIAWEIKIALCAVSLTHNDHTWWVFSADFNLLSEKILKFWQIVYCWKFIRDVKYKQITRYHGFVYLFLYRHLFYKYKMCRIYRINFIIYVVATLLSVTISIF